ncbi:hypothetical protein ACIQFZ_18100 [Streptomyces sp. NPDC093064]|uniref:hypothetical protein n=1 Tax=Streptomyces sp. NPDC093064 TaxID=3366020 RepID=UPI00381E728F
MGTSAIYAGAKVVEHWDDIGHQHDALSGLESLTATGGSDAEGLCLTTSPTVLAAGAKAFPLESQTLPRSTTAAYSATHRCVPHDRVRRHAAGATGIVANYAATPVAVYKDVQVGDTVEFAGVWFEVSNLAEKGV